MSHENTLKVTSPLYLLRSTSDCWKCGANQDVIALATRRVIEPDVDVEDGLGDENEPVILSNIEQIPEAILRHILATHPGFEKRTSRTAGNAYYMNICSCGAHFGDFYLHSEPSGAFFPGTEEDASRIVVEELPFTGVFDFRCGYGVGLGAFIFEHGRRRGSQGTAGK